jgi:hypothetical protein
MNQTSVLSPAVGWLASGVAQPAANTAITTHHLNLRPTIAPLAIAYTPPAAAVGMPAIRDVDLVPAPLTGSPQNPSPACWLMLVGLKS